MSRGEYVVLKKYLYFFWGSRLIFKKKFGKREEMLKNKNTIKYKVVGQ